MLLSIVKSELYRASKFKSLWILTIILFLLMLMTGFTVLKMDMMSMVGMDGEQFDELVSEGNTMDAFQAGLDAGTSSAEENTANVQVNGIDDFKFLGEGYLYRSTVAKFFQVSQASLNGTLLIAIFIGLFAGDVYNTGINKNNIKAMNRKSKILMGRLIVIAIYTFVMHIIHYIFSIIIMGMWAEKLRLGFSLSFIRYFFISWLLTFVFASLVFCIAVLSRSKAASIAIGVIIGTGFLALGVSAVNYLINKELKISTDFNLGNYLLTQNLASFTLSPSTGDIIRVLVVAAVFFAAIYALSYSVIRKRDVI